ncbi:hypothetical protein PVAND_006862 [Polypedilum vanderplanki]|uniref:Uncharacterized protein n=1 Tax=Polypedilum vanderplanki TaxID=319348 RepID=A0A9J6C650_POLVA|nr:hypothetical protein PVAND_006862 [Polypedilum vanderplanki]
MHCHRFNERSSSSVRDRYSNDPAYTEDVRHLALPLRRNSGPSEFAEEFYKMFGKKKSKSKEENSSHYSLRMERKKKAPQTNNHSAEYLCKNTSSSESLDNIISSYKMKGRKGFSLDRDYDAETKPQMKPKRSSWFLRDKNRDKQSKNEKFLKRSSLDFTVSSAIDKKDGSNTNSVEKNRTRVKTIYRQNAADYTGDSSTTPQEEIPEPIKKLSKFQIGKRFLKGEIGIRSFNYYLLKEGLKKNTKQKQEKLAYMSKSEENIYEEIFFHHDQPTPKPQMPPALPPLNKQNSASSASSLHLKAKAQSEDGNCLNCEICIQEAQEKHAAAICTSQSCDKCIESSQSQQQQQNIMTNSLSGSESYAKVTRKLENATIYDFFQQPSQGQTVLQFQSYNPNNPTVYKIETTPVAFDYNPIEEQIYQQQQQQQQIYARVGQQQQQSYSDDVKITKSSSSSDSIKGQKQQQQTTEFYTRPNYFYPTNNGSNNNNNSERSKEQTIYKTDSFNSLHSENSLNKIYNSSQKSNHNLNVSNNNNGNRDETQIRQDMSDSSLGDSLFSSDANNKRYFGSSESCRFNYECGRHRCSPENEKCSFSDTCRYECNLRNCDCSSSYFSSDFDDTNIYNTTTNNNNNNSRKINSLNNNQQQQLDYSFTDAKSNATIHYAEDFIKHVSNVKRRSQNMQYDGVLQQSIYEVPKANPKRLDIESIRNNNVLEIVERTQTGYYITSNDDELTIAIKESSLSSNGSGKALTKNQGKSTGTVPKSSISSNDSKRSSTRSSQKQAKRNQAYGNENSLKLSPGNENLLSLVCDTATTTTTISPCSSASKIVACNEQKIISAKKINEGEDTKSKNEKQKQQQPQPKIEIVEDEDDEVFLDSKANERKNVVEKRATEIKFNEGKKSQLPIESNINVTVPSSKNNSPYKSPLKAFPVESLKTTTQNIAKTKPADTENNNKSTEFVNEDDDDDDSVFINENKQKKPKNNDATSAKQESNVSSLKSNNEKTSSNPSSVKLQTQNQNSRESNVQSDTTTREKKKQLKAEDKNHVNVDKKKKEDTQSGGFKHSIKQQSNDSSDQIDFNNIPLPDIPTKKNKNLNKGKSLSKDSVLPTSTAAKIQSKWKQLTEKEYFKKMHYRNSSFEKKPTYLFGENAANIKQQQHKDGIFLNRSGWLTTSSQRLQQEVESRKENISKLKKSNSKIEELISRSEARRANQHAMTKDDNVTILKIDPQSERLNDRPAYLPVKTNLARDGPPPTPILSPPPAFQDHQIRNRIFEMKNGTRIQLSVTDDSDNNKTPTPNVSKGMVFSRSFEYDNRKTSEFNENFSRSFDFDFQLGDKGYNKNFLSRFDNLGTFANYTGKSPNYLTKKEKSDGNALALANTAASIFPKVIPGNKIKMGNSSYYNSLDDAITSRRQKYDKTGGIMSNYRSLETGMSLSKRLNSCDSGARSDFSNDDLDDDEEEEEDQSSSLALSYKSAATTSYLEPLKNSNRNVTKTLLNQQQQQQSQQQSFKKTRSMTPDTNIDDYDLLTVDRSNTKRQRSLTPEKRPITPELLFKNSNSKLNTSQTSLMSRQSSNNSRNSTLERQLKRYEEGRLSRSSSSSSDGENNGRVRQHSRPPFKNTFGDYRIRRSRSLQLSERSPNRSSLLQKLVVRIGNTATSQQATQLNNKYRDKAAEYTNARSKTTLSMPTAKYNSQSLRNSDNSLPSSSSQAKSYEVLDFNGKSSVDYGFESDSKSKSFDDDFCFNTKVTRNSNNSTKNVFSGNRAFSQDRVLLVPPVTNISKSLRNSPRNYGSRLYDHDMLYDVAQRTAASRSPLMNYRGVINPPLSRERSPVGGRKRERDYKKHSSNGNYLKPKTTTTPNRSPNRSPSDSDDSINESVNNVLKDKSLVAEYLFGLKRKQQANRSSVNHTGTASSSGSCTSSSCEFWPHANKNGGKKQTKNLNGSNKINMNSNDSDSSGNNMKISVNTQKQRQQAFRSSSTGGTTIKVNGGNSASSIMTAKKLSNSSIIFLGDCEMPITKSGSNVNSVNDSISIRNAATTDNSSKYTQKIQITSTDSNGDGELKQQFAVSSQQTRAQNYTKGKYFTPLISASNNSASIKRRHFTRLQSRSLPRSFMRSR